MSLCALYAPTRHLPLKVRLFIDYLVERFNPPLSWELGNAEKADVKARRQTSKVRN